MDMITELQSFTCQHRNNKITPKAICMQIVPMNTYKQLIIEINKTNDKES